MTKSVVGIDIGDSSVKVAELELKGGRIVLSSCDVVDFGLPPGATPEERETTVIEVLGRIFEERRLKSKTSILSVSGQSVFIRSVKLPMVGRSKLNRIVRYEAQQQVPFPIEEIAWDYQIIQQGADAEGGVRVRLVAIKSELVDQIVRPALSIKLFPEVIDVGVLALYNSLDFIGLDLNECQAVLEIGAKTTNISVISQRDIWTRSIPVAGNAFTRDIKNALNCEYAKAEELKLEHGLINDPDKVRALKLDDYDKALNSAINRFVAEITRSFGFYKTQICQDEIKRIYLVGGSSELKNLDTVLTERFKLPVEKLNVLSRMAVKPEFEEVFDVSSVGHLLGTAVGLGLRRMRRNPIEINLLPPRMIQEQRLVRNMAYYFAAGALAVVSLLTLFFFEGSVAARLVEKAEQVRNETDSVRVFAGKIDKAKAELQTVEKKFSELNTVRRKRQLWLSMLSELHNCIPENIWLVSVTQSLEAVDSSAAVSQQDNAASQRRRARFAARPAPAAGARDAKAPAATAMVRDVYIVGETSGTYRDITAFADLLKKIRLFETEEVKILSAKPPDGGVREFTVKAQIRKDYENE